MTRIIIDTDIGDDVDDVLALAFALSCPQLDVRAITTVTPGSDRRAGIVKHLLHTMEHTHIPVASGIELPMRALSAEEQAWMMSESKLNYAAAVPNSRVDHTPYEHSASLIIRTVEQHAGEIGIVAIGPLSNVALALRHKPAIAAKISWIAFMGGEVHIPRRENNIAWDPEAAEVILTSGIPLFMGSWSVTRQFALSPVDCERIAQAGTALGDFLDDCIKYWWPYKGDKAGPVMYDMAPLVWAIDPSCFETKTLCIRAETTGTRTRGMTLISDGPPNAHVTQSMNEVKVRQLFMHALGLSD